MFSIYTSAIDVNKRGLDYADALNNFCRFASQDGEVKIAVSTNETDNTYETLYKWKELHHPFSNNLEIFFYRANDNTPNLDGVLKNGALQESCKDIGIGVDFNDRLCYWQIERWEELAQILMETYHTAVFIPSFQLGKDTSHFRSVENRWHIHKREGARIGIVDFAKLEGGQYDPRQSDGYDLINSEDKLFNTIALCQTYTPGFFTKHNIPFTFNVSNLGKASDSDQPHNLQLWK